jgi:hypothetical protein
MPKLWLPVAGLALMAAVLVTPRAADATVSMSPAGLAVAGTSAVEQAQMKCAHRRVCRPGRGCAWRKVCKRW